MPSRLFSRTKGSNSLFCEQFEFKYLNGTCKTEALELNKNKNKKIREDLSLFHKEKKIMFFFYLFLLLK